MLPLFDRIQSISIYAKKGKNNRRIFEGWTYHQALHIFKIVIVGEHESPAAKVSRGRSPWFANKRDIPRLIFNGGFAEYIEQDVLHRASHDLWCFIILCILLFHSFSPF